MSITYHIDHSKRLVVAKGSGTVTGPDIFGYQESVWSRQDVSGYDELVDMTETQKIEFESSDRARDLASLSASKDPPAGKAKFAIVAPGDQAFGLGQMYKAYRSLDSKTTKQVEVFRTREEALAFLGVEGPIEGLE